MAASINRWIARALLVCGLVLAGIGGFFALFGGMNDGFWVGLKLLLVPGFIAAAMVAGSFAFRAAARAHASGAVHRRWIQLLAITIACVSLMLSMYAMSLLDRILPN